MRWFFFGVVSFLTLAGCDDLQVALPIPQVAPTTPVAQEGPQTKPVAAPATPLGSPSPTIAIASFNIQVLGESKLKKRDVMDVLTQVVRRFDVVAVQELRAKDQGVMARFLELINADGSLYDCVVGPRLGRSSSKEQYVFLFNTRRIAVDPNSIYTIADPQDLLHREPLVARFQVLGLPPDQAFTFTLVNIHTDPDETATELNALDDVFQLVQRNGSGEDDVILLGDLNVDAKHLGQLGQLPNIVWTVNGQPTNTLQNKSYDNLVFDRAATSEFTGRAGVLNLAAEYGLSQPQALEVSDHFPVWAEFTATEGAAGIVAGRPRLPR